MRKLTFLLLGSAILVSGCERRQRPAPTPPVLTPPPVVQPALSPADYFRSAASIDLLAIRASEYAMRNSTSARTRQLAQMLLQDHRGSSSQLSFAGRRLNLLPSATLLPRHQALLTALQTSPELDRTFLQQQVGLHEEEVRLHGSFAQSGQSPTLRPVAEAALGTARRHLERLRAAR